MAGCRHRDRCTGHRRDGKRCGAHAIPGGTVCELHGGGAPQVRIAAEHRELQFALLDGIETHRESGDFEDLCKVTAAQRALEEYEAKLEQLSELRRSLNEKRAAVKARQDAAQLPAFPERAADPEPDGPAGELLDLLFGRPEAGGGTTRPSPFV